jgi:hypothetical protein
MANCSSEQKSDLSKTSSREILEHGHTLKEIIPVRKHKKSFTKELWIDLNLIEEDSYRS